MNRPLNPISKTPKTDYQIKRDALIPEAELFANGKVGAQKSPNDSHWAGHWTTAFLGEMDRLAYDQGIVKHQPQCVRKCEINLLSPSE